MKKKEPQRYIGKKIRYTNICVIGVPKENEKEKETQNGI